MIALVEVVQVTFYMFFRNKTFFILFIVNEILSVSKNLMFIIFFYGDGIVTSKNTFSIICFRF